MFSGFGKAITWFQQSSKSWPCRLLSRTTASLSFVFSLSWSLHCSHQHSLLWNLDLQSRTNRYSFHLDLLFDFCISAAGNNESIRASKTLNRCNDNNCHIAFPGRLDLLFLHVQGSSGLAYVVMAGGHVHRASWINDAMVTKQEIQTLFNEAIKPLETKIDLMTTNFMELKKSLEFLDKKTYSHSFDWLM